MYRTDVTMEFSTPLKGIANPKVDIVYSFPPQRQLGLPYVHGLTCLNDLFREFPLSVTREFLVPTLLVQCRGPRVSCIHAKINR
jgi:hypothetical protein